MSRIFILTMVVFIAFIVSAIHAEELPETFKDKTNGYEIDYPQGWKARPYISGIIVAEINRSDRSAGFQIRVAESNLSQSAYSEQYIKRFVREMRAELLRTERLSIDGLPAVEYDLKSGRGQAPYFLKSWLIFDPTGKKNYIIQSGCPMKERSTTGHILSKMAESFRLNR